MNGKKARMYKTEIASFNKESLGQTREARGIRTYTSGALLLSFPCTKTLVNRSGCSPFQISFLFFTTLQTSLHCKMVRNVDGVMIYLELQFQHLPVGTEEKHKEVRV